MNMQGDIQDLIKQIYLKCHKLSYDFAIVSCETELEIQEMAKRCKNGNYIVYAIGDDKDLNLVLNELIGGKAKLGIIPCGYYNDFYRSIDEYRSEIINTNVMKVNELYGLNNFNLGISAEINANMKKLKKLPLPKELLDYLSTLYTYFKFKNQVIGVNDFFEKKTLLAICNGFYYRGGKMIAPRANIRSNDVFIVSIEDMPKLEMVPFYFELMHIEHEDNPYVDLYTTTSKMHIETMNMLNGELDGRILKGNDFVVIPNASNIDIVNNRKLIRELRK